MSPKPRRARTAIALALAVPLALIPTSATAADPINWTGESAQTLEYGQYWTFGLRYPVQSNLEYTYTNTGTPSGFLPQLYGYPDPADNMWLLATMNAPYDVAPLKVGSYTFSVEVKGSYGGMTTYEGETATPAQLTVTPAKLGVALRVIPDPSNTDVALVTAGFTGRFVEEYQSSFFPGAAVSPAGEWRITFVDSTGEVAIAHNVERAAGDDVLATSFAWADAEPGETYAVSAEFVPAGASGTNFSVTPANDFSYTAPSIARPVPTSSATEKPDEALPEATGFGIPLWILILVIALIVGLATLVTILSVRLSRRSTPAAGEVSA